MAEVEAKEKATSMQICKLFARQTEIDMPEQKLIFAVLSQAVSDVMNGAAMDKIDAVRFFKEGRHHLFCDIVGLNGDWVSEIMRDHAGLGAFYSNGVLIEQ